MTEIGAWKCDICGDLYLDDNTRYHNASQIEIHVIGGGMLDKDYSKNIEHACMECRNIFDGAMYKIFGEL